MTSDFYYCIRFLLLYQTFLLLDFFGDEPPPIDEEIPSNEPVKSNFFGGGNLFDDNDDSDLLWNEKLKKPSNANGNVLFIEKLRRLQVFF